MKKCILCLIISVVLSGCMAFENYKFGDATRLVLQSARQVEALKEEYCNEINAPSREVLLKAIRLVEPKYEGVCNAD